MDPYRQAIEDRIAELHKWRRWIRANYPPADAFGYLWRPLAAEYRVEAGALNRLRNQVRKAERAHHAEMAAGDFYAGMGR